MADKKNIKPKYVLSPLNNKMLNYSVYYMSFKQKIIFACLAFIIGGLVGLVFYGGLFKSEGEDTTATLISNIAVFCIVGLIAIKASTKSIKEKLKSNRDKKIERQFMDLLENLSTALSAGNTVNSAFVNAKAEMANQYSEKDLIIQELSEILLGLENGKTLEEMLLSFGKRSGNEDIENFSNVMSNCYRLGGDFKKIVSRTRNIISDKIAVSSEIETKLASNKLQFQFMCFMPIALVAMLKLTNGSFRSNLASPIGVVVTTIAIAIFVISYFWGKKIINIR